MARITVLSPVPRPVPVEVDPGPSLTTLEGATVGIRTEWIWPAFNVIADEWQRSLEEAGARVVRLAATSRLEAGGDGVTEGLPELVDQVDLVVVGLGN